MILAGENKMETPSSINRMRLTLLAQSRYNIHRVLEIRNQSYHDSNIVLCDVFIGD